MNKLQSKYFNTAKLMNTALLQILEKKELEFITVKEICKKAGVNRSTFYLHYENIGDLVSETIENISKEFYSTYSHITIEKILEFKNREQMVLIKPEYITPYLNFIKKNIKIYKTIHSNRLLFKVDFTYKKMREELFYPILSKFNIPNDKKPYILGFYTMGVFEIIKEWINKNCKDSVEEITNIIIECINFNRKL